MCCCCCFHCRVLRSSTLSEQNLRAPTSCGNSSPLSHAERENGRSSDSSAAFTSNGFAGAPEGKRERRSQSRGARNDAGPPTPTLRARRSLPPSLKIARPEKCTVTSFWLEDFSVLAFLGFLSAKPGCGYVYRKCISSG